MVLISTATSPFGRKVKIAALAHGLHERMTVQNGDPWTEGNILREKNPLGKMPALITKDGQAIYDSGVILEYFDSLLGVRKLFPAERFETRIFHALGSGLIEAGLLITYERNRRPKEYAYEPWMERQTGKLERGLASLCANAPDPTIPDAGAIAVACALGYFDWRKQIDWRARYPVLVDWLNAFREATPAFDATKSEH
jgi:glutathione S-transferase